mmetsp:Transcript_12371/g.18132  ORF Transcript_12371/g.18132 Transcript_12371/m.18132 type:complete len:122 (-) Transcript_12371:83-448(-)
MTVNMSGPANRRDVANMLSGLMDRLSLVVEDLSCAPPAATTSKLLLFGEEEMFLARFLFEDAEEGGRCKATTACVTRVKNNEIKRGRTFIFDFMSLAMSCFDVLVCWLKVQVGVYRKLLLC